MGQRVCWRPQVHPHLPVTDLHRKDARVIRPLIKGPATGEIKTCMVPMTCQNAIFYRAAVQGKTHMGASVVHSVDLIAAGKEHQRVPFELHRQTAGGLNISHFGSAQELVGGSRLGFLTHLAPLFFLK